MITKRTGNGQTECARCKEKGKFALTWDSFLFTYNDKPYCSSCLFEMLEEKEKIINDTINYIKNSGRKVLIEIDEILEILERGKNVNSK